MRFHVESMTCGGCARSVTKAIQSVDPDARVEADPPNRSISVDSVASPEAILKALDLVGYPASAT